MKYLFHLPALAVTFGLLLMVSPTQAQTFANPHIFIGGSDGGTPKGSLVIADQMLYGTTTDGGASAKGTVFTVSTNGNTFAILHNFTGSDGANPKAGLILAGNTLYGTTATGGSANNGVLFAVKTDGSSFTVLHHFTAFSQNSLTNSDGAQPLAGLVVAGNTLYGTAAGGGITGYGTVFAVNTNGSNFTTLHHFTHGNGGAEPHAGVALAGNTLYGTVYLGGNQGGGAIFALNTNGADFSILYNFSNGNDGGNPVAGLVASGTSLFGTALNYGAAGRGTVFSLQTNGTSFTLLHTFSELHDDGTGIFTNRDGTTPVAGLYLSGNTLYGAADAGGSADAGTIYSVQTDGTGFTNLHNFIGNSDGKNPVAALTFADNNLYGTASVGGGSGWGTVFNLFAQPHLTITPDGSNVLLTWPTNATGFVLQSTTGFNAPVFWNNVTPAPTVINGLNTITNGSSGQRVFYRLIFQSLVGGGGC